MPQLALPFDDEVKSDIMSETVPTPLDPDVERILGQIAEEEAIDRLSAEDRQRHWARVAEEDRRRVTEERRNPNP